MLFQIPNTEKACGTRNHTVPLINEKISFSKEAKSKKLFSENKRQMIKLMLKHSRYMTIQLGEINPLVTKQEFERILQILEEVINHNFVKQN